ERTPNKSALNQLRVNEFLGGPLPGAPNWRLYEYKLACCGAPAGHLLPAPVAQTPAIALNKNANHTVNAVASLFSAPNVPTLHYCFGPQPPLTVNEHLLGGWAPVATTMPWDGSPTLSGNPNRHAFAMVTCNGCHGSDAPANPGPAGGDPFTHVSG